MEREAEDVLAVLDAVDAELLVGHSYGALCSILAAERTGRLRGLVLYEPPIAVPADRLSGLDELVARGDLDAALEGFLRSAGAPDEQFDAIRSSPAWPTLLDAVPALPPSCTPVLRGGTHEDRSTSPRSSSWAPPPRAASSSKAWTTSRPHSPTTAAS
jgi:pimeloyl-ACP methyl ester carboxylesterase